MLILLCVFQQIVDENDDEQSPPAEAAAASSSSSSPAAFVRREIAKGRELRSKISATGQLDKLLALGDDKFRILPDGQVVINNKLIPYSDAVKIVKRLGKPGVYGASVPIGFIESYNLLHPNTPKRKFQGVSKLPL